MIETPSSQTLPALCARSRKSCQLAGGRLVTWQYLKIEKHRTIVSMVAVAIQVNRNQKKCDNDVCSRYIRACVLHILIGTSHKDVQPTCHHQNVLRTVGDFFFADHPDTYGCTVLFVGFFQHGPCYGSEDGETTSQ